MFLSKTLLLIGLETIILLILGNAAFVALFLTQKKKNIKLQAFQSKDAQSPPAADEQPLDPIASYQAQIEDSLQQLLESLPQLIPCSDPQAFANASHQEQAKIIRYIALDYEKQLINNTKPEDELAASFVTSISQLFPDTLTEGHVDEDSVQSAIEIDAEIEKLNQQIKVKQDVIDQFARDSRDMLNCMSILENENRDLRKLMSEKTGRQ